MTTLVHALRTHAAERGDDLAFVFQHDDQTRETLTFRELAIRVSDVAGRLEQAGARDERAMLLFQPGLDFIVGILACFWAGTVAVPVAPPRKSSQPHALRAVIQDAGARFVLSTAPVQRALGPLIPADVRGRSLAWVLTDAAPGAPAIVPPRTDIRPSDLAFLQYTSGSTGTPKGVMVSHANIIHNMEMERMGFENDASTVYVSWLPLFHDMGLIGQVFQSLFIGVACVLMSPVTFLTSPISWLRAISDWKATTSGGPSFAYEMCVHKIRPEDMAGIDLSSWTLAFNGAEPVKARVIDAFAEKFAPFGFRKEAFYPCYGLAEATLFVTGGQKSEPVITLSVDSDALARKVIVESASATSVELVGCGVTRHGQRLAIVAPETRQVLPDGAIGEIWISGPSVAGGYWNRPAETDETFRALTADGDGPFLRTGDLGFLRAGQLFVTGRIKDLIIIRGRNYYPHDIESAVSAIAADVLRPGGAAAFAVERPADTDLVLVCEVQRELHREPDEVTFRKLVARARKAVADELGLTLSQLVLIPPGTLPKTSSGKIRRNHCRELFLRGELPSLRDVATAAPGPSGDA